MCGIAGIVGGRPSRPALEQMAAAMEHRGPDDVGYFESPRCGLAFRRLSIVDLDGGRQPMTNEDGRVVVVFNGEIYNHPQLRALLVARGHVFKTDHSDTEVIVHGWEEWGEGLFARLNGMFAIGIWDQNRQTLVLARDRYGIKPLYFSTLADGRLVFASEVKSVLASGEVPRRPSAEGVLEYFHFQNLWRETTMFAGVSMLPAGTTLCWRDGQLFRHRFWDISFPRSRRGSLARLADEHREIVRRVVRRQIAADVPVMSFLSGGIDSTAITVASYQLDPRVKAYSCIFNLEGVGDDRQVDEREFSRLIADTYRLERVELELSQDSLRNCLGDYVYALEDLRMGMGYPVYLISQRVARDSKVVLSGTGGDEFHGGYLGRYIALGLVGPTPPPPRPGVRGWIRQWFNRPAAFAPKDSPEAPYRSILNFVLRPDQLGQALDPEFLRQAGGYSGDEVMGEFLRACPSDDWRDRVMYVDAKTYLAGLLALEDKLSMAHSLEARVPLLDNELVDFILDVPFETLCAGDTGKILFRESVRPWVPEAIYKKPKMGFGPPDASWYRTTLRPWIESSLSPERIRRRGIFQPAFVASMLDDHFSGRQNRTYFIWSLLNFEAWCERFGFYC